MEEPLKEAAAAESLQLNETIKFTLNSSNASEMIESERHLDSLLGTPKNDATKLTSQSIESIHRTEACVFYVLSPLSHGDKPSVHLFTNFEAIITCILSYLKNASVRNPRALRILNRLTKNTYCFYSFVLNRFPYRLKSIFFEGCQVIILFLF